MKRRLALRSEYLAPLSSDELGTVVGGSFVLITRDRPCPSIPDCIGQIRTIDTPCPTEFCTGTTSV